MFRLLTQGWHCGNDAVWGQAARSSDHQIPHAARCTLSLPAPAKFGNQQAQACRRLVLCPAAYCSARPQAERASLFLELDR